MSPSQLRERPDADLSEQDHQLRRGAKVAGRTLSGCAATSPVLDVADFGVNLHAPDFGRVRLVPGLVRQREEAVGAAVAHGPAVPQPQLRDLA